MMDDGTAFLIGLFLSAMVIVAGFWVTSERQLQACAIEHNIYRCEWVAVPKEAGDE